MENKTKFKVGDSVKVLQGYYHASKHPWSLGENSDYNKGKRIKSGLIYTIQDVDYDYDYLNGYVVLIDNVGYGSVGLELCSSPLHEARKIIYNND